MNRNRYQLVFNVALGKFVPQPETARRRGKTPGGVTLSSAALVGLLAASGAGAGSLPGASNGVGMPVFAPAGNATYQTTGNQMTVSQTGNRSILNWKSFNVGKGSQVLFQQVDSLSSKNPVAGASFTSLNRIWDVNPSLIAGSITQAPGQQANVILVNTNGIAFMNGAQVNLNSFTATSLNIADKYITGNFLGDLANPQFQMDPTASPGFVAVLEGAQITAGSQGRVMLIAPTVINRGTVTAPDGQVILAAGAKAYLRSNDNSNYNLRGLLIEVDSTTGLNNFTTANPNVPVSVTLDGVTQQVPAAQATLGMASNTGKLSTPRGNITMVGFAVNQSGIANATTSVVSNGSIYLMAKDTSVDVNSGGSRDSSRAGQVILGNGSQTQVAIETADTTTTTDNNLKGGNGLDQASEVRIMGQRVYVDGASSIKAPSGIVSIVGTSNPNFYNTGVDALNALQNVADSTARVHVASGATIDVSGLQDVDVSVARNVVQVQLRGDELKDSPVNQAGPIRGTTVYVDIGAALANSNAGKSTLIAADSLAGYANQLQRTAAERATKGGTVAIQSDGESIVEAGSHINLSGGSINYLGGFVPYSLLSSNGKLTDVADALSNVHYTGIPTSLTVNYSRWARTENFGTNLKRFVPSYVEGKAAGTLSVQSIGTSVMQGSITGAVKTGARQQVAGTTPSGATLQFGTDFGSTGAKDFKINQAVRVGSGVSNSVMGLAMDADLSTLVSTVAQQTLEFDANQVGEGGVANLVIYSNHDVSTTAALRTPQKGSVQLTGSNVKIGGDITAPSGTITANAIANNFVSQDTTALTTSGMYTQIADGVKLSTAGVWVNDRSNVAQTGKFLPTVDGGTISLTALSPVQNGVVSLGAGAQLDSSAGAHFLSTGTFSTGKGGSVAVAADEVVGLVDARNVSAVKAYAASQGGSLSISSQSIKIGGPYDSTFGAVNLDPLFFTQGGFSNYALKGYSSLKVASGAVVLPTQWNYQFLRKAATSTSGTDISTLYELVKQDDFVRGGVNLTLQSAQGSQATGVLTLDAGSVIEVDKGASVSLSAHNAMLIQGTVRAPGGNISLTLDQSGNQGVTASQNLLWLSSAAVLDASGVPKTRPDTTGGQVGAVLGGGQIHLSANTGFVVAENGSTLNVNGASAVTLDVLNESGRLGRSVASDAGSITVFGEEGVVLQSNILAKAGAPMQRGGNIEVDLSHNQVPDLTTGFDLVPHELHLAANQSVQTSGFSGSAPTSIQGVVGANLGWDVLQASGADTVKLVSRDAIILDNGLNVKSGRSLALRELTLDSARLQTNGGDVKLAADSVTMGNFSSARAGANLAAGTNAGTLSVQARKASMVGNLHLNGMSLVDINASELIELAGVTRADSAGNYFSSATINSMGDLSLISPMLTTSSDAKVALNANGKSVTFRSNGAPAYQPYSVAGSLTVNAQSINQAGNILMPFGAVDLEATASVTLEPGSQISVADQTGVVMPLGQTVNGSSWVVNLNPADVPKGQVDLVGLPQRSVKVGGSTVNMQGGSQVNVSGGGDVQAYEFTVGPGGSKDILTNPNTFAILPGYAGGYAPVDPQENFSLRSGSAVYLKGVSGLANGTYTLLPAHYALLPGAYAVQINTGINILPGQAYTQQDGVRVAAGYLTDTRPGAPTDAVWQGIQVLSNAQVRARSELTLTNASTFFSATTTRVADAGNFSAATSAPGAASLKLNGEFLSTAGSGGNGMTLDISAPNLAVVSGSISGIDTSVNTILDVSALNRTGATSVLLGGIRSSSTDANSGVTTTTLNVGASNVTLANDQKHPLLAPEVILAATNTVTLKSGSAVTANTAGTSSSVSRNYTSSGMGALVRVADSAATFSRTGNPGNTQGTLTSETDSVLTGSSVTLDATSNNSFKGSVVFKNNSQSVAGNLSVGAPRVNFGSPIGPVNGITYSQEQLDALSQLTSISFTSYNTLDFYGDATIGGLNSLGTPAITKLTLHGAGIAGYGSAANTIKLRADSISIDNASAVGFNTAQGASLGSEQLQIAATTLTLGANTKTLDGLSSVQVNAQQLIGQGVGMTSVNAPVSMFIGQVSGSKASNQTLNSTGGINLGSPANAGSLAAITDLGAQWSMSAPNINVDTQFAMPSGTVTLTATGGDLVLGSQALIDVSGRSVAFFDQTRYSAAGSVSLNSATGNVSAATGATVNVSAVAGGDAGRLALNATGTNGQVQVGNANLLGTNTADSHGNQGLGAQINVDTGKLVNSAGASDFSSLNSAENLGGFADTRSLRVRNGDITVGANDLVSALNVVVSADAGKLDFSGKVLASGDTGGTVGLYGSGDVTLFSGSSIQATGTGKGMSGGKVEIGSVAGMVGLSSGSTVDISSTNGGVGGSFNLRAARNGADVNVSPIGAHVIGTRAGTTVEAVKTYADYTTANTASGAGTLTLATINSDDANFSNNYTSLLNRLDPAGTVGVAVISGVEIRSTAAGNLTLANDFNLGLAASHAAGKPGILTLRSAGNLTLNGSLSDGFSAATPTTNGSLLPPPLLSSDSWGYRLVSGADFSAANPMTLGVTPKDFTLAANKLVRTGTGEIKIAASGKINLSNTGSVLYTAGSSSGGTPAGFTANQAAYFTKNGGDVSLVAGGDINGTASTQLYSEWLFREGQSDSNGSYVTNTVSGYPSWWVRFDQFKQGVAALGGGKVLVQAGGTIRNLSASSVTQGQVKLDADSKPYLTRTGGGDVTVQSGGDILGGQYFADASRLTLKSAGKIDSGQVDVNSSKPLYTILADSDGLISASAVGDLNIQAVFNPTMLPQSRGGLNDGGISTSGNTIGKAFNVSPSGNLNRDISDEFRRGVFASYGPSSEVDMVSLNGQVTYMGANGSKNVASVSNIYPIMSRNNSTVDGTFLSLLTLLPGTVSMTSMQGSLNVGKDIFGQNFTMAPSASGQLELLAQGTVNLNMGILMNDSDPALLASALNPAATSKAIATQLGLHSVIPVHTLDATTSYIYANNGNVQGVSSISGKGTAITLPKAISVRAGQDVADLTLSIANSGIAQVSTVQAARDVIYTPASGARNDIDGIQVAGTGSLEVTAGRNVSLGTSGGIVSIGNLQNPNLPSDGADIHVAAGVGQGGVDFSGALSRLVLSLQGTPDDATVWQARWLTGDTTLNAANAIAAVQALRVLPASLLETKVRNWIYTALRTTGRDYNTSGSSYAGDYTRGYAALALLFPGIEARNADGTFTNYAGDLNMFASRIKSTAGGDIDFMVPGGNTIVGLANTPAAQINVGSNVLGVVVNAAGNISGFARNDITVNQSRILAVGGGDVLLWSSDGDIDAGKGKKTASAVPPPIISVDSAGNVTQTVQGAATGSGIGALAPVGVTAGSVDLVAPKGTINAGDAGIRAGTFYAAAKDFKGADNVSVSGKSVGVPVPDTSAVTAAASGATTGGDDGSKSISASSQAAAEAARSAQQLASSFKPTMVSVDVLGYGE